MERPKNNNNQMKSKRSFQGKVETPNTQNKYNRSLDRKVERPIISKNSIITKLCKRISKFAIN